MAGADDVLARALGYPYAAHPTDYLFRDGQAHPLPHPAPDGLTPVIAVGSNRAPAQLARKYAGHDVAVPVTRAWARDVDVVHAAHLAAYGAVPATLARSPGTEVELWITWLDPAALQIMDATEAVGVNYDRVTVALDWVGDGPASALLYAARRGLLRHGEGAVALAQVPARQRRFPAMTQEALLRLLHGRAGSAKRFEDWLLSHVGPDGRRRREALTGRMAASAIRGEVPGLIAG